MIGIKSEDYERGYNDALTHRVIPENNRRARLDRIEKLAEQIFVAQTFPVRTCIRDATKFVDELDQWRKEQEGKDYELKLKGE